MASTSHLACIVHPTLQVKSGNPQCSIEKNNISIRCQRGDDRKLKGVLGGRKNAGIKEILTHNHVQSDFDWYEAEDSDVEQDCASIFETNSVDIISRWHELRKIVDDAGISLYSELSFQDVTVNKNIMIPYFLVSTRCFDSTEWGDAKSRLLLQSEGYKILSRSENRNVQLTWAITEIRIVRKGNTTFAEYLIACSFGDVLITVWKRFSDFEIWGEWTQKMEFSNSSNAWARVNNRKKIFRCLDTEYLNAKSKLIGIFLKHLLFDAPSCTSLLSLFLNKENGTSKHNIHVLPFKAIYSRQMV